MRLLNWHLGYWFKKKKRRRGKKTKHYFFFKMPLEIILSPRLSGSRCSLCFSVWGRSEPFPFILSPSFLYLLYLLFPQFLSEITGPFFFLKKKHYFFLSAGWKTRGKHRMKNARRTPDTHTHTHIKNKKKKLLVWNRAVALKCHKYFFLSRQGIRVSDLCFPAFFLFSPSALSVREDLN